MANKTIIKGENIYKTYGDVVKTEVLHGLDFKVDAGEFISIIGPSGSGKSTLLNLLGALDRPTEGKIEIADKIITELNDDDLAAFRNNNLGFVFQFHHLLPEFTAIENVFMPHWIRNGAAKKEQIERAEYLLDTVGLLEYKDNLSTQLSGGQKQRVAIARSLMNNPPILLADEPTGNLDTESSEQVFDLLRKINEEFDTIFIIVTHDRHIAGRTDRILELIDGNIVRDMKAGSGQEVDNWEILAPDYCLLCREQQGKDTVLNKELARASQALFSKNN
ncbi:MAG: ABC transporter ATP-binding protein [Halanaerobiaceae bacterium]